jgi:Xaa-Pro dipeptidase
MKSSPPFYSQGLETYRVPLSLYAENRHKVLAALRSTLPPDSRGVILLQGGTQPTRHDTDHEPVFRQESYFHYCFGVHLPDCYGALSFGGDDGPSYETTLFVPTWDEEVATVCGEPPDFKEVEGEMGVDSVRSVEDLAGWIEEEMKRRGWKEKSSGVVNGNQRKEAPKLFLLKGLNSDSRNYAQPAHYEGIETWNHARDDETLFRCIAECRVKKVSS